MFSWLLVNIVLSVLALTFITLNASAPHRLRFIISIAALLAWSIPWQLVPEFLPHWQAFDLAQLERSFVANTADYSLRPVVIVTTSLALTRDFFAFTWMQLGFLALCGAGLLMFGMHCAVHYLRLRQLRRTAQDGAQMLVRRGLESPVPVFIQSDIAGAFSSGLITPRIWIHEDLLASTRLATLLRHELTHIEQHDNWYLLCITFIEKLFWWNPLVWLLGRQARELQELSCDVLCQRASADYPLHLAELMIDNVRLHPAASGLLLSANIFNKTSLNIKRIKLLQRSYAMKARHFVSVVVTVVGAIAAIGIVTAQPEVGEMQRMIVRGQSVHLTDGGQGDVLFVTQDPVQPLTESEAAAFAATRMFVEGSAIQDELIAATPGMRVMSWHAARPDSVNQFIEVTATDGDLEVSLDFTDTPLAMILEPLANIAANGGMPALGLAAPGAATQVVTRQIVEQSTSTGATAGASAGGLVTFQTEVVPPGAEPFDMPVFSAPVATMSFVSRVVMEDEADKERLVSVAAEGVSITEALEIIGAEANCNIFVDDETIVVNSCAN